MSQARTSFPLVGTVGNAVIPSGSAAPSWDSVDRGLARLRSALEQAHTELHSLRRAYDQAVQVSRISLVPDLPTHAPQPLSAREYEVAALLASGRANREIALVLHVSVHTVNTQVKSILRKLGVRSRWQVADAFRS